MNQVRVSTVGEKNAGCFRDALVTEWSRSFCLGYHFLTRYIIGWNVAKHYFFDPKTNDWTEEKGRPAKCYVLCVYTEEEDRSPAKVLDLAKWEFYVVPTKVIARELSGQKTVVLSRIKSLTDAVTYSRLGDCVDEALAHG